MSSGDLLNEFDLSEFLDVSVSTLRKWRMKKIGPKFIKIGRSVRYPKTEVKKYMDDQTVKTKSKAIG